MSLSDKPVTGRTYTLFGPSEDPESYYRTIIRITDGCLTLVKDLQRLLKYIRQFSRSRHQFIRRGTDRAGHALQDYLNQNFERLAPYTWPAAEFEKVWKWEKLWDRHLRTTQFQHHLFMIEIELNNQINTRTFYSSPRKIALLPYCLQDFEKGCQATFDGTDYACAHCSNKCYVNAGSKVLKGMGITPYLWQSAGLETWKEPGTAVLGIACIPELTWGLRKCEKLGIPAVGIPLNANRCKRWMDEFKENSYSLVRLKEIAGIYPAG